MNCLTIHSDVETGRNVEIAGHGTDGEFAANSKGDQGSTGIEMTEVMQIRVKRVLR